MLAAVRRVPLGEAVPAAALALLAVAVLGPRPLLLGVLWLAAVTPRLVAVDLAEHRLPDAIVLPGYPVVLAAAVLDRWSAGADAVPVVIAGAASGLLLLLLHAAGGMGLGDVKLVPLLGMLTAAVTPAATVLALMTAFLTGGVAAAVLLVRAGRGARMPFGPALLLGAWLALLLVA